jgi:hypothetical protein
MGPNLNLVHNFLLNKTGWHGLKMQVSDNKAIQSAFERGQNLFSGCANTGIIIQQLLCSQVLGISLSRFQNCVYNQGQTASQRPHRLSFKRVEKQNKRKREEKR